MKYVTGLVYLLLIILLLPDAVWEKVVNQLHLLRKREIVHSESSVISRDSLNSETEGPAAKKVKALIDDNGILFPKVVYSQAIHETANFTSTIFKENNNCFGMKLSQRGWAMEENRGHASYASIEESVREYAAYQRMILFMAKEQSYIINSDEQYLWLLDNLPFDKGSRYAEDPNYTKSLRLHMKKLK